MDIALNLPLLKQGQNTLAEIAPVAVQFLRFHATVRCFFQQLGKFFTINIFATVYIQSLNNAFFSGHDELCLMAEKLLGLSFVPYTGILIAEGTQAFWHQKPLVRQYLLRFGDSFSVFLLFKIILYLGNRTINVGNDIFFFLHESARIYNSVIGNMDTVITCFAEPLRRLIHPIRRMGFIMPQILFSLLLTRVTRHAA